MAERVWQVQTDHVMAEVLEGEAVIIDMASGRYHAASGVGATIWEAVTAGQPFDGILTDVRRRHSEVPADAAGHVERFLTELVDAGLVTVSEVENAAAPRGATGTAPTPWKPPSLETHNDLQDLLLLDPVHEVTEAGWPHAAPEA